MVRTRVRTGVRDGGSGRWCATAVVFALLASGVAGQVAGERIGSVVRGAADVFAREYFDATAGARARAELLRRLDAGAYAAAASPADLADRLTRDLRALTSDKHVAVALKAAAAGAAGGPPRRDVPTRAGFRRVEILPGNIGLLDMAFFLRPAEHRDALADAMRTLQPAGALILDMRANGGGSPDTVALLIGYLLDTPAAPLFDIRHRDGRTVAYATADVLPPEHDGTRPVYVLTSAKTFSAGEGLPFLLQERRRALVIGERTAGAANPGRSYEIDDRFEITVPNGQVVSAIGRSNWEGGGVTPDVRVAADQALDAALARARAELAKRVRR